MFHSHSPAYAPRSLSYMHITREMSGTEEYLDTFYAIASNALRTLVPKRSPAPAGGGRLCCPTTATRAASHERSVSLGLSQARRRVSAAYHTDANMRWRIANRIAARKSQEYTALAGPSRRIGRLFLDSSRNGRRLHCNRAPTRPVRAPAFR